MTRKETFCAPVYSAPVCEMIDADCAQVICGSLSPDIQYWTEDGEILNV